jgi:MoaA/NifB/PqqE/SkfB family radical SAM enzyme
VSFLLHGKNWHRAEDMLALSRSLGATYTTFRPMIEEASDASLATTDRAWITEAMPTLEAMAVEPGVECDPPRFAGYRDWSGRSYSTCYGVRVNATVTPDGRVWLCPQRRGMAGSELGDLRRESFADIWARHPGQWTDFSTCRVMCRLHLLNEQLAGAFEPRPHEAFL